MGNVPVRGTRGIGVSSEGCGALSSREGRETIRKIERQRQRDRETERQRNRDSDMNMDMDRDRGSEVRQQTDRQTDN